MEPPESTAKVLAVITAFLSTRAQNPSVSTESRLMEDLNIDSLALVSLIVRLEEELNVEINDEAMVLDGLYTVQDIINAVEQKPS